MAWIKVRSWHIERPGDQTHTLCGLTVRAHPDPLAAEEHQAEGWSEALPNDEKSCESCLRLEVRRTAVIVE